MMAPYKLCLRLDSRCSAVRGETAAAADAAGRLAIRRHVVGAIAISRHY